MFFQRTAYSSFVALCVFVVAGIAWGDIPVHLNRDKLGTGCATCHYRSNFKGGGGSDMCLVCHGDSTRVAEKKLSLPKEFVFPKNITLKNVEEEFKKTYHHPTFDARGVHRGNESLPETDPKAPRHADCADCHNPHLLTPEKKFAGISGRRIGNLVTTIAAEYELCYKCHGESANLPGRYSNKRAEFSVNNASFHPVEGEGKNLAVVSLLRPYREKKSSGTDVSTISCGDCHGSDSADAPKGPHGSSNQYILVDNYSIKDKQPESAFSYALCYRCHSRSSILGNESFKYHSMHIQGSGNSSAEGTSCYTCHNSHGSTDNRYLIRFNADIVSPNARGLLKFVEKGVSTFRGECFLSCHGVDHDPKGY